VDPLALEGKESSLYSGKLARQRSSGHRHRHFVLLRLSMCGDCVLETISVSD